MKARVLVVVSVVAAFGVVGSPSLSSSAPADVSEGSASAPPPPRKPWEGPPRATGPLAEAQDTLAKGILAERVGAAVDDALRAGKLPGCVVVVGRRDRVLYEQAFGARALLPSRELMTVDTVFDLASLTKPLATATSLAVLVDRGAVALDDPLTKYVPELRTWRETVTLRQLLLHVGGLPAEIPIERYTHGRTDLLKRLRDMAPRPPGEKFVYGDLAYFLLEEVVRRVSGTTLPAFAREAIFEPLGMKDTTFLPPPELAARAAPTELRDGHYMRGEVHDPRAHALGGAAGHAGLFSTAKDLTAYAQMILGGGRRGDVRVLGPRTLGRMTAPHDVPGGIRALGWDVKSTYSGNRGDGLSRRSFGHGGYTGTALWIDPASDLFVLFLSNRVHPDGRGAVNPLIHTVGSVAAALFGRPELDVAPRAPAASSASVATVSPPHPPASPASPLVRTGIDVLRAEGFARLTGARVGLLVNDGARTRDGMRTLEAFRSAPNLQVVALFTPEHGLTADREGKLEGGTDPSTGLPLYSLYGKNLRPSSRSLAGIDVLVVDLQDAGTRFFTYVSTLRRVLEATAEEGVRIVVLDRPNPLGGSVIAGPVLESAFASFVNDHALPLRHGMTFGELALLLDAERHAGAALEVVPMEGWRRGATWDETGLPWVPPSPNLRTSGEVLLYPAVGLVEGTNVSVGRGTPTPFEILGAPWMEGDALAAALAAQRLPGVAFESTTFTPDAAPYRGEACRGVRLRLTEGPPAPGAAARAFDPVHLGLLLAQKLRELHGPRWKSEKLVELVGNRRITDGLLAGRPLAELEASLRPELDAFRAKRDKYLLYPE